jgi:transcriptional regulator with XRE-family HTH domain
MTHDTGVDLSEAFRLYVILLRDLNGWTQARAAETFGIKQSALSKVESGRMKPGGRLVLKAYAYDPYLFNWYFRERNKELQNIFPRRDLTP